MKILDLEIERNVTVSGIVQIVQQEIERGLYMQGSHEAELTMTMPRGEVM